MRTFNFKKTALLVLAVLAFVACKKDKEVPFDLDEIIVGEWVIVAYTEFGTVNVHGSQHGYGDTLDYRNGGYKFLPDSVLANYVLELTRHRSNNPQTQFIRKQVEDSGTYTVNDKQLNIQFSNGVKESYRAVKFEDRILSLETEINVNQNGVSTRGRRKVALRKT